MGFLSEGKFMGLGLMSIYELELSFKNLHFIRRLGELLKCEK